MTDTYSQPVPVAPTSAPVHISDFILGAVAHELRAPLSAARLAAQLMSARAEQPPAAERHLRMIDRHLDQMARLVDDLFEIGRAAHGRLRLSRQWLPLIEILETAVEAVQSILLERHQRFRIACDRDITLYCDKGRMIQVMTNLFANAARYTPERGDIHVEAVTQGCSLLVHVMDTGIGLSPQTLSELREPASKWRSAASTGGGMGIGLLLARVFVQLHGGIIEAESAGPGGGSRFTVRLPIAADVTRAQ